MSEIPDVFRSLNRSRVRYLLVGGLASVLHGVPRSTVDIDILVAPDPANVRRTVEALVRLGLSPDTRRVDEILGTGGTTFEGDVAVDVLTDVPGVRFADLWRRRISVRMDGVRIWTVTKKDQVRLLRVAGRPKDLDDAGLLEGAS